MSQNPSRVVEALTARGVKVGAVELREFSIGAYLLLQKIGNPLVCAEQGAAVKLSDLQVLELLFVLSRPAREANEALAAGREAFEAAVIEFAEGIALAELPRFEEAVRTLMERAVSTAPSGAQAEKKTRTPSSLKGAPAA